MLTDVTVQSYRRVFCSRILVLGWSIVITPAFGEPPIAAEETPNAAQPPPVGVRDYAPGVRIDWRERAIEIDAKVVLREGALELLACSPHTREHESIFVVGARPLHIHQALGLIGLQPGRPVHYDEETDRWFAPHGEPLSITVSCRGERAAPLPARAFLKLADKDESPDSIDWVWAGSRVLPDGRFGADLDGTVICVVDFSTALITVGALHTSDDVALWLEANTEIIPPIGTPCVLRVAGRRTDDPERPERPAAPARPDERDKIEAIIVELTGSDAIRMNDTMLTVDEFTRRIEKSDAQPSRPALRVRVAPSVTRESVDKALERLRKNGFEHITVEFDRQNGQPGQQPEPPKNPG